MKSMTLNGVVHIQARSETIHSCDDVTEAKVQSASDKESLPASTSDLRDFIAFEFSLVEEVEYVFTALRENQIFYVWIITNEFELSVRERIYARQQAIIDEFEGFDFDFYIIARMERNIGDLMGDDSMHLTYARP